MDSPIQFPGLQMSSSWALPSVYTPERIECLGRANAVARQLRDLGYRTVVENPMPEDESPATIQIDVGAIGTRPLRLLGGCTVRQTHTGIEGTTINEVLVLWRVAPGSL